MLHQYRVANSGVGKQCVEGYEECSGVVVLVEAESIEHRAQAVEDQVVDPRSRRRAAHSVRTRSSSRLNTASLPRKVITSAIAAVLTMPWSRNHRRNVLSDSSSSMSTRRCAGS